MHVTETFIFTYCQVFCFVFEVGFEHEFYAPRANGQFMSGVYFLCIYGLDIGVDFNCFGDCTLFFFPADCIYAYCLGFFLLSFVLGVGVGVQ